MAHLRSTMPLAALLACLALAPAVAAQVPSDSAILTWLVPRLQAGHLAGAAIGTLDNGREHYLNIGQSNFGTTPAIDRNSVFEIGSITKVFTNVLLADMVLRGEVSLDDPVQKFLPATVKVPTRGARQITLLDLATASSGLPRLPTNMAPRDPTNPYADYSVQQLYDFLSSYTLSRDIGSQYEYSNLGMGLLGHALALRAGTSYEALLIERVLTPLGMHDTRITLTPSMQQRFVTGHDADMEAVPAWDLPTLAAAGGLRSTASDMLKFARAALDARRGRGPLAKAFTLSMQPRRPAGSPAMRIGLGWHVLQAHGHTLTWHNGGTGGFRTWMGVDSATNVAAVVLTNGGNSSDEIGLRLLDAESPLRTIVARPVVTVPADVLDTYVGRYVLSPAMTIVITRTGESLYATPTGQPRLKLWASSAREFSLRVAPVSMTFEADTAGMWMQFEQGATKVRVKKQSRRGHMRMTPPAAPLHDSRTQSLGLNLPGMDSFPGGETRGAIRSLAGRTAPPLVVWHA